MVSFDGFSFSKPLVYIEDLKKFFGFQKSIFSKKLYLRAVDGITFEINQGEILALVGESGSGKTTIGRILAGLEKPTEGKVIFDGKEIVFLKRKELKSYRRRVQIIFQNPYESLDPRWTIENVMMEPLIVHGIGTKEERKEKIYNVFSEVGLEPPEFFLEKFPHELSGGQRQRIALARAMILEPNFIIADEPVSMLDVSLRAGILNLIKYLRDIKNLTILFITHDLSVARYISHRIAVIYLGKIMEIGPTERIVEAPAHPYSQMLISSVPIPEPVAKKEKEVVTTYISDPTNLPKGCRFYPNCPFATELCRREEPQLLFVERNHKIACHLYRKQ